MITSIIVEHLSTKFQNDATTSIAYLYCNYRRQQEQKPADLLASILKQLIQPSMPESVKNLHERHRDKRTRPSFGEISEVLHSVVGNYSRTFIIIDALDECQVSDGSRKKFLSEMLNLQAKTGVSLFATSRFIPEIMEEVKGGICISLEISASDEDVRKYLDGHMLQLPSFVLRSLDLQEEIKTEIIKAVDGMYVPSYGSRPMELISIRFLLAQLHLRSLIGKRSPKAIRTALKKLPKGSDAYDHAYKEAMERIEGQIEDSQELAKQVLSWITCAKRPLTTLELRHALAVEVGDSELDEENLPDIENMISVCAGLVTIDEESNIIRLVHYTTQEYFERTWVSWFPDTQRDITSICVTYLSFDAFKPGFCPTDYEFEARLRSNPLYDYAARNWGFHAQAASVEVQELILDLLKSEAKVSASSQAMMASKSYPGYSGRVPKQMIGVHLAAYFGLREAMTALLKNGNDLDVKDTTGRTPLLWAAKKGHEAMVRLLLEKGAELESKDKIYGQTPLSWAAKNGHEVVVKLLLDKGAEMESKDTEYDLTPLSWAARYGNEAAVKLLLEKGAEMESKDKLYGQTPLSLAAKNGHEAVVKLLLEKGAELESKDTGYGQTPLSLAARYGNEATVKLLLEKGAELESKDKIYDQTPLSGAARYGNEAVVKLLLEKGAELESKDKIYGQTLLSWAAKNGHEAVVKLLLEKGAELEPKDSDGWTPLSLATRNGHKAMVKLLLEKGAGLEP